MTDFILADLPRALGHIVHFGAGQGDDLAAYLAAVPTGILLVEPDEDALDVLLPKSEGQALVRVLAGAVATGQDDTVTLRRFTLPGLSSLRAPTHLQRLYPGLKELPSQNVTRYDPVSLVRDLSLNDAACHILVIEACGAAMELLAALAGADLLAQFDRVVVQEGLEPLYDGSTSLDEIQFWLGQRRFTGVLRDTSDPDCPHLRADHDRTAERLEVLEHARAEAELQLAAARTEIAALASARDAAITERDAARENAAETSKKDSFRLAMLRDEMLRSEGQITLIRDLLLRGQNL